MSLWLKFVWLWSEIISEYDIYPWQETFFCHHLKCFFLYVGPHLKRLLPVFTDNRLIYMSLENEVIGIIIHETDFRMQYCCQLLEKIWWQKKNASAISMIISSVQFSSVAQLCPTFCNPMDCSTPGFPVHHQFLELAHSHVHWVHDAIQPYHPLSSPSPPAFNLSQHQSLFQWVSSLHQVASASASVLPVNIQDWFHLGWTGWISLQSKGLSRVFSNTTVQKHQFFGAQLSL